jgi:HD-GYP domain-containing protein (c-di-GMP phosphodiesterase class II)
MAGDAAPLEARILGVADVWDALTSDRACRPAWTPDAARDLLQRQAGQGMDAACVAALFRVLETRADLANPGAAAADPRQGDGSATIRMAPTSA